jgi:hypothetical protein
MAVKNTSGRQRWSKLRDWLGNGAPNRPGDAVSAAV